MRAGLAWILAGLVAVAVAYLGVQGARAPQLDWRLPYLEVHPSLSGDGRYLVCELSRAAAGSHRVFGRRDLGQGPQRLTDLLLFDTRRGRSQVVPTGLGGEPPNGSSYHPQFSADGRRVVFISEASNLVSDDRNSVADVFVLDRESLAISRIVPPLERFGECSSFWPGISSDAGLVGYSSFGTPSSGRRFVLCDVRSRANQLCPVDAPACGRLAFAPDNRTAAGAFFIDSPVPTVHIDLFELTPGKANWSGPVRITEGADEACQEPVLAADQCLFSSYATNLVAGCTSGPSRVFACDLTTGAFELVSRAAHGEQPDDSSFEPAVSDDGRWVAFTSFASNLVAHDTNGQCDVFLRDRHTGVTRLLSRDIGGRAAQGPSYNPCVAADGRTVAFVTRASNLGGDRVAPGQVYIWKRETDELRRVDF